MTEINYRLYPYRWVVLSVFMFVNVMVQVLWICYAPVASQAMLAFGVGRPAIDMLANLFMIIYLPVSIPAAWAIDYFGFRKAVSLGSLLMAAFGLMRALFPCNYTAALIGSIGIAVGQPFLMNAFTKIAAQWFPLRQRATITGVCFVSVFLGIGLGEALGPSLLQSYGFGGMQALYGAAAVIAAILFVVFARSTPPTPVGAPEEEARALVLDGLKRILRKRDVYLLSLPLFLASGIVNGMFTLVDGICMEKGLVAQQGVFLTTMLLAGGIVGTLVLPGLSDMFHKRKSIIYLSILAAVLTALGVAYGKNYGFAIISYTLLGFFLTGVVPVVYQYGAEITHPAPEGTSNGIFALVNQASGLLIVLMDMVKTGMGKTYLFSLAFLAAMLGVSGLFFLMARESPEMQRRKTMIEQ